MTATHIAQLNIGRFRFPTDDPRMAGFMDNLDRVNAIAEQLKGNGAEVGEIEKMGKRRLAYTVRRFHDGIYVLMVVEGGGPVIHELERRLRVTEPVIKFLTVRVDEEHKRDRKSVV